VSHPSPENLPLLEEPQCVHCGLCLSHCPTYLETGDENESPRGRLYLMRALDEGRVRPSESVFRHLDLCLDCRACETACPCGVPYGKLLEEARARWQKARAPSFAELLWGRIGPSFLFVRPWALRAAIRLAHLLRRTPVSRQLPRPLQEALRLLPTRVYTARLPTLVQAREEKGRVALFTGCVTNTVSGQVNQAAVRLLNRLGFTVVLWKGQRCCGALDTHSGRLQQACRFAKTNIASWEAAGSLPIIVTAAGCGSTLREYQRLLSKDPSWEGRAKAFSRQVFDLSLWLVRHGAEELLAQAKPVPYRVTYHEACHLAHAQRIREEPAMLVRLAAGPSFTPLPESDLCCGSAGVYNLLQPEMARRLQERKIQHVRATGARCVVTTNPGCMYQIESGLVEAGVPGVRVLHLAEFLDEVLP
jgi:glycolate oxidase iron-sulfur subunit